MTGPAVTRPAVEFLDLLSEADRDELIRCGARRDWAPGEVLFREGDRTDFVVILARGQVKVTCDIEAGGEVLLAVRGPGTLLGEIAAIDGEPRSATVIALEPVTAIVVPFADFSDYLLGHLTAAILLLRLVASRLRDADRKRFEFGAFDTTGRVAARLVELAERFGSPVAEGVRIQMPLSQDELAAWTGASREAVARSLRLMRAHGWISTGRKNVIIRDVAALRDRAQSG
ncbi:MAG TPA: Crp/Fnr family transcriptional regulator [Mycobacteriales bacterium]|nr:Crp/Fnr family transcriptional regulator [Mycobacteriales bacterium]